MSRQRVIIALLGGLIAIAIILMIWSMAGTVRNQPGITAPEATPNRQGG